MLTYQACLAAQHIQSVLKKYKGSNGYFVWWNKIIHAFLTKLKEKFNLRP